jgi:hypothetical protein
MATAVYASATRAAPRQLLGGAKPQIRSWTVAGQPPMRVSINDACRMPRRGTRTQPRVLTHKR